MIRMSSRVTTLVVLVVFSIPFFRASAQQNVPPVPTRDPSALAPTTLPTFPKPDPANFTATAPTKETIDTFMRISWGFDETRIWQIQAILKTPVEDLTKVVVLVGDKTGKQKSSALQFFVLPDGRHIIAGDEVINFGVHPYAASRELLQQRAEGPYRGSVKKDLEIVDFTDFQCPHCKEARATMAKLEVDFPNARIVFQNFPLKRIHSQAMTAASYGICVANQGGSSAFFTFAAAVFDGQDGLATPDGATLTLNSAVTKAGLDPAKISTCAAMPATAASVDASVKLAEDLDINQTPTLMVNGRQVPGNTPYDTLKKIIEYQEKLDGLSN
jgi:protein-disulfide isomerase